MVEWVFCFRPVEDFCQASPVRFVRQVRRQRLGTGDDQTVEVAIPQILDTGIEAADMTPAPLGSRNIGQCVERQAHHDAVRRRVEER